MAAKQNLRHLLLTGTSETERYRPIPGRGDGPALPARERQTHGKKLLEQLRVVREETRKQSDSNETLALAGPEGLVLEFSGEPGFELGALSLEAMRSGIELLNVREVDDVTTAAVFVPDGKLQHFERIVTGYLSKESPSGEPRRKALVDTISSIRLAHLQSLWTDERDELPPVDESCRFEVWLRAEGERTHTEATLEDFRKSAQAAGIEVSSSVLFFPGRIVVTAQCALRRLVQAASLTYPIAELRRSKELAGFFSALGPAEQYEWVADLARRVLPPSSQAPRVSLLDTGVTQGHPLLHPALEAGDLHTIDPAWDVGDHHGHGTEMAGLSLYGDLTEALTLEGPVKLEHRLESVKILPPQGDNKPELYGAVIQQAVDRLEVKAPGLPRILLSAVSALDSRDRGQPSSWSGAIDSLASGDYDGVKRLFIQAAGNTSNQDRHLYPDSNQTDQVHDPGQAWNALVVGASTEKVALDPRRYPGWSPVAEPGGLSPSSCTSLGWAPKWPIKPDIVLEGGNQAREPSTGQVDYVDDLQLLSTYYRPLVKPLVVTGDTSAAAAQAARMAALLQSLYPQFWPETIRGFLAHAANWTPAMKRMFPALAKRNDRAKLLQCFGFGVPRMSDVLWSAGNALTLVVQDELYPYAKGESNSDIVLRDMHLHTLPWPQEALRDLGEIPVELRVTLSYFIEPNPARRSWKGKYSYASHGIRFEVKTPTEDRPTFRGRVNSVARQEEAGTGKKYAGDSERWYLGPDLRSRGSLHSDRWMGTAAQLADKELLAVFPVSGWWKENPRHGGWLKSARYSLIVTIRTQQVEVDLYTPVLTQLETEVEV